MNTISRHLNNVAFVVQAFEYKENEDVLNFIVFTHEKSNQASEIFMNSNSVKLILNGYKIYDYTKWNDQEFIYHVIQLIRKYNMTYVIPLLSDAMYCRKHFNMVDSFLAIGNGTNRLPQIQVNGSLLWPINSLSDNSRKSVWKMILNRIYNISDDVSIDIDDNRLKSLRIPDVITIDEDLDILEVFFKVGGSNYRNYFYKQNVYQGDNVLLISDNSDRFRSVYLYKVRFVKEESIILDRCDILVNSYFATELLQDLGGENNE